MRVKSLKKIELPRLNPYEHAEWCWARGTKEIEEERICMLEKMGINICPMNERYMLV
jgi:hypothetical protein